MSRYVTMVLTGVSAVALSTMAVPAGQAASGSGVTHLTPFAAPQSQTGSGERVGSWCC